VGEIVAGAGAIAVEVAVAWVYVQKVEVVGRARKKALRQYLVLLLLLHYVPSLLDKR
jgi:hypothetical protein